MRRFYSSRKIVFFFAFFIITVFSFFLWKEAQEESQRKELQVLLTQKLSIVQTLSCSTLERDKILLKLIDPWLSREIDKRNAVLKPLAQRDSLGGLTIVEKEKYEASKWSVPDESVRCEIRKTLRGGGWPSVDCSQSADGKIIRSCKGQKIGEGFTTGGYCEGYVMVRLSPSHIMYRSYSYHKEAGTLSNFMENLRQDAANNYKLRRQAEDLVNNMLASSLNTYATKEFLIERRYEELACSNKP